MQVTIHAAKTQLSKLIEAALAGEEVIIARGDKPLVKLAPLAQPPFRIGLLEQELAGESPDFFAPMNEEDLWLWEGRD